MPFTVVAFSEEQDTGGNFSPVSTVADSHVTRYGDDLIVPELNKVILAFVCGATVTRARLSSPSLRRFIRPELNPLNVGVEPTSPLTIVDLRDNPIPLETDEALNVEVIEGYTGAERETVILFLADGTPAPVTGDIFTVRGVGTTTLNAYEWTNVVVSLDEDLPVGNYQLVGMRAESAGLIACRVVPVGGIWRSGVIGTDAPSDLGFDIFRRGRMGVFCEFAHNRLPTFDFFSSSADTSEVVYLDLIKM